MKSEVKIAKSFQKDAKPLIKKYASFPDDLEKLIAELIENPKLGIALGNNLYKIRLPIRSKGKGKSGGARVISYVESEIVGLILIKEELVVVNLIAVYDKSEKANISDSELKELIKNIEY